MLDVQVRSLSQDLFSIFAKVVSLYICFHYTTGKTLVNELLFIRVSNIDMILKYIVTLWNPNCKCASRYENTFNRHDKTCFLIMNALHIILSCAWFRDPKHWSYLSPIYFLIMSKWGPKKNMWKIDFLIF